MGRDARSAVDGRCAMSGLGGLDSEIAAFSLFGMVGWDVIGREMRGDGIQHSALSWSMTEFKSCRTCALVKTPYGLFH